MARRDSWHRERFIHLRYQAAVRNRSICVAVESALLKTRFTTPRTAPIIWLVSLRLPLAI